MPTDRDRRAHEKPDHRRRVIAFLALLSSDGSQEVLGRSGDRERVAFELSRLWFDEIYRPSARYLEGLKGDRSETAVHQFNAAFDEEELALLERFHRFFELRMDMLRSEQLARDHIPVDDRWRSIMRDAGYLLDDLGVDAAQVSEQIKQAIEASSADPLGAIRAAASDPDTGLRPQERRRPPQTK